MIRYHPAVSDAISLKRNYGKSKNGLVDRLRQIDCTGEDLDWAAGLLQSRCFKHGGVRMTAPGIDLCNHAGENANSIVRFVSSKDNEWMKLQVAPNYWRNIEVGEEISISYGYQSNDIYFSYFGFVPNENDNDTVVLFDDADELSQFIFDSYDKIQCDAKLSDIKADALEAETQNNNDSSKFYLATRGRVDKKLSATFIALRLNETQIANLVQRRCYQILKFGSFVGTTVAEDKALVHSSDSESESVCARYRLCKKNIYAFPLQQK